MAQKVPNPIFLALAIKPLINNTIAALSDYLQGFRMNLLGVRKPLEFYQKYINDFSWTIEIIFRDNDDHDQYQRILTDSLALVNQILNEKYALVQDNNVEELMKNLRRIAQDLDSITREYSQTI